MPPSRLSLASSWSLAHSLTFAGWLQEFSAFCFYDCGTHGQRRSNGDRRNDGDRRHVRAAERGALTLERGGGGIYALRRSVLLGLARRTYGRLAPARSLPFGTSTTRCGLLLAGLRCMCMRRCISVTASCACLVIPQAVVTQVGGVAPTLMNESAVPSLPDGGAATGYAVRDAATRTRAFGVLRFFGGGRYGMGWDVWWMLNGVCLCWCGH